MGFMENHVYLENGVDIIISDDDFVIRCWFVRYFSDSFDI